MIISWNFRGSSHFVELIFDLEQRFFQLVKAGIFRSRC